MEVAAAILTMEEVEVDIREVGVAAAREGAAAHTQEACTITMVLLHLCL